MSNMYDVLNWRSPELETTLALGLSTFSVPDPITLEEWAREHFYLSKESSYVEQSWVPWTFQRAILACMSNDDIRELDFMKSARVGYTKMLLASVGYNAEHKRRNQVLWQPTDGDSDEFVKTELDPMLRDVKVMANAMPAHLSRHKDNTLAQKKFLGCMLHTRGGTAARAYRRISVDVAYMDELDAFLRDIEKEGSPDILGKKRVEGATFPKFITGSTPKLSGFSLIEDRHNAADERFKFAIPCPECGEYHALSWGGKEDGHGFKWLKGDPSSVRHVCPHNGCMITQAQYLAAEQHGRWQNADGSLTIDVAGVFRNASGEVVAPPAHIAFHVWTAYSPMVSWSQLVVEFLDAYKLSLSGDISKLKAFTNTTLGLPWVVDMEKSDAEQLRERAEPHVYGAVMMGCLLLLAGVDVQDNRIEVTVWGYGRGCQKWHIEHKIFYGNPSEDQVWSDLAEYLFENEFQHASGRTLKIYASAIDTGGHNTHAVYNFVFENGARRVFAVRGRPGREKHIKDGVAKVDIDWRGRVRRRGLLLWHVGTNLAKDLIFGRLQVTVPGPGYMHFSKASSDEWFKQFAGEARVERATASGNESRWKALRKRVEALDCTVYVVWLETHLDLAKKKSQFWDQLEAEVQPSIGDLFSLPMTVTPSSASEAPAPPPPAPAQAKPSQQQFHQASSPFASDDWASRGFR